MFVSVCVGSVVLLNLQVACGDKRGIIRVYDMAEMKLAHSQVTLLDAARTLVVHVCPRHGLKWPSESGKQTPGGKLRALR